MAYKLNSAKDSLGNEDQFMADFNAKLPQILAYKAQHGGDLEHAYQGVTGIPWPKGRSVKLHDGVGEMTKDRTIGSVLGKYVAPIGAGIATAFVPGLAPALGHMLGIGGGAAGSAAGGAGVGIGETGATMGLAGSGLAGSAGGLGSAALGTAGTLASSGLPGSLATGASSILPAGSAGVSLGGGAITGGGLLGKAGSMAKNFLSKEGIGDKLGDLGKTLGSFGEAEAQNRTQTGEFMQNYDQLMQNAQTGRNQNESDALKKLAQTKYILGGGSTYGAQPQVVNSGTLPTFANGPTPSSDAQKQGAQALQDQLVARLAPGGSYMPTDPTTYTKPGTAENISKWGGLISSGLGLFGNQSKPSFGVGDLMKLFGK